MPARPGKVTIYHDGRCPFCQWSQHRAERYDRDRRLEFRDYHLYGSETPFSPAEFNREMHVQTLDGGWHIGYFGWIEIMKVLPRWRRLARLLSLAPLRWIGPRIYRWIAANRYRIPQFLLCWLGAPAVCGPACDLPPAR